MSQYELTKGLVELCRTIADSTERGKTIHEALVTRDKKKLALTTLMKFKKQVPELVPESIEDLQERLNRV